MAEMTEIVVRLSPQLGEFVRRQAKQESFASAGAYVAALLHERFEDEDVLQRLEKELDRGLADLEAGRVTSIGETFDSVHAELGLKRR